MSSAAEPSAAGGVRHVDVGADEAELRLDRWFKRHFPDISHGRLEKLLRTGQVRIDGRRAKARDRLAAGQSIRVPPLGDGATQSQERSHPSGQAVVSEKDTAYLRSLILYRDNEVLAINKPHGLAVQGGSGLKTNLDAMLDALRFDAAERPRLVHRLDKDTGGVLLLARTARAATALTASFRTRDTLKTYWALVAGVPSPKRGQIDQPLAKRPSAGGEKVMAAEDGRRATTRYAVVEAAARRAAWLAMRPITGRTHQLRVHATVLGTPIVGDGKYGGSAAFLTGVANRVHLHSRSISITHPRTGKVLIIEAPLTAHMRDSWKFLGFDEKNFDDPFAELDAL